MPSGVTVTPPVHSHVSDVSRRTQCTPSWEVKTRASPCASGLFWSGKTNHCSVPFWSARADQRQAENEDHGAGPDDLHHGPIDFRWSGPARSGANPDQDQDQDQDPVAEEDRTRTRTRTSRTNAMWLGPIEQDQGTLNAPQQTSELSRVQASLETAVGTRREGQEGCLPFGPAQYTQVAPDLRRSEVSGQQGFPEAGNGATAVGL